MDQVIEEHKLSLRAHPEGGWIAETARGGRLHRGPRPTREAAVAAAKATLDETAIRAEEARADRLFDLCAIGDFYAKPRRVQVSGEGEATVWDVFATVNDLPLVLGERSLRAAVIEAEKVRPARHRSR